MKRPISRRATLLSLPLLTALFPETAFGGYSPTMSNVFSPGDVALTADNIQGDLIAGGNGKLRAISAQDAYVQGDLNAVAIRVPGSVQYGGTLTNIGSVFGSISQVTAPLIDLAAAARSLVDSSTFFGGEAPNGSVTQDLAGNIILTGTDPYLNIFDISAPNFNAAVVLNIPAGSTALVNISDQSPLLDLVSLNGSYGTSPAYDPSYVLFNFPNATSLTLITDKVMGTILAPRADVVVQGGTETGTLIAGSLSAMSSNFFNSPFRGDPSIAGALSLVPEPPSAVLLGIALATLAAGRRLAILATTRLVKP